LTQVQGNPAHKAGEESTSEDELLAELEAYERERERSVIREEPRRQEAWWGGIIEPLQEVPLEPEPVAILRDLIQLGEEPASVPDDAFGTLEEEVQMEIELSLLLDEFTTEREWGQHSGEALMFPGPELGEEGFRPSHVNLSTPDGGDDLMEEPVGKDKVSLPLEPGPTRGWELISGDPDRGKVVCRLAYIRRFINSCWGKFRPMSRELSPVETDLAGQHLDELMGQGDSFWGESSVGWAAGSHQ
jgi:hypothetical protein